MKIVFSRKGFDSRFGGAPSPIINGRPLSLPIPGSNGEITTYADRGLARIVEKATQGRLTGASACHDDPMFAHGHCWLGQVGAAQGHLLNQRVRPGDVFLFFGLFADPQTGAWHHRIFGYMRVLATGSPDVIARARHWVEPPRPHPHFSGTWQRNNAIWFGTGKTAPSACEALRLTAPGERRWSRWHVPEWLIAHRPTYLKGDWRWIDRQTLDARGIWQEAVCDIGEADEPRRWLDSILCSCR
ncbi:MAG: hypothetical protein N2423_09805 [Novosphingobium sp.]|nr:hypothetical protein [Novosphingobium sp.]